MWLKWGTYIIVWLVWTTHQLRKYHHISPITRGICECLIYAPQVQSLNDWSLVNGSNGWFIAPSLCLAHSQTFGPSNERITKISHSKFNQAYSFQLTQETYVLLTISFQTVDQFQQDGCDNCDKFLQMKNNSDRVDECTSQNFDG